jgi:hypothetical protein
VRRHQESTVNSTFLGQASPADPGALIQGSDLAGGWSTKSARAD